MMPQLNFQCYICADDFENSHSLGVHIEEHEFPKAFKCGFCDGHFHESSIMISHISTVHGGLPFLYNCGFCKEKFQFLSVLEKHVVHCQKSVSSSVEHPAFDSSDSLHMEVESFSKPSISSLNHGMVEVHPEGRESSLNSCNKAFEEESEESEVLIKPNLDLINSNEVCQENLNQMQQALNNEAAPWLPIQLKKEREHHNEDNPDMSSDAVEETLAISSPVINNIKPTFSKIAEILNRPVKHSSHTFMSGVTLDNTNICDSNMHSNYLNGNMNPNKKIQTSLRNLVTNRNKNVQDHLKKTINPQYQGFGIRPVSVELKRLKTKQKKDFLSINVKQLVKYKKILPKPAMQPSEAHTSSYFALTEDVSGGESSSTAQVNSSNDSNSSLSCRICSLSFDDMDKLEDHISNHDPEECYSIQCMQCKAYYDDMETLKNHLRDTDCPGFTCSVCNMSFGIEASLLRHKAIAHKKGSGQMKCDVCGKVFSKSYSWGYHAASHAKSQQYVCKLCNKRYANKKSITGNHLPTVHSVLAKAQDKRKIKCDSPDLPLNDSDLDLNKQSTTNDLVSASLPIHLSNQNDQKQSTQETPFSVEGAGDQDNRTSCKSQNAEAKNSSNLFFCRVCSQSFGKYVELQEHIPCHTIEECYSIQCVKCKAYFNDLTSLENHVTQTDCPGLTCSICKFSFGFEAHLIKHNVHCHKSDMKCGECDKTFLDKKAWARHEANHVKHRQVVCKLCNTSFPTMDYMRRNHLPNSHNVTIKNQECKLPQKFILNTGPKIWVKGNSEDPCCKVCSESFKSLEELKLHLSGHAVEECFHIQCPKCKAYFDDEVLLENHVNETDCPGFACSICNISFGFEYSYLMHKVQAHKHDEKKMKCEKCNETFVKLSSWAVHEANHSQCQYECKICNKKFHTKRPFYETHMSRLHNITSKLSKGPGKARTETAPKYRVSEDCDLCGGKCADKQSLATHRLHHFMEGKFSVQCSGCPESFSQMDDLNSHVQHRQCSQFYCDDCKQYFPTQHNFVSHRAEKHATVSISGVKQCLICCQDFEIHLDYVDHMTKYHVTFQQFHCKVCSASFSSLVSLKLHLKEVHTLIENEKELVDFRCSICLGIFSSQTALKFHRCFHRRQSLLAGKDSIPQLDKNSTPYLTPFFCPICSAGFGREKDLDEHKQLHSDLMGEKSECPTCRKTVLNKYLKDHLNMHKKDHLCTYCGKAFPNLSVLKNHTLAVHSEKSPFQCQICHKVLSCAEKLEHHTRLHTGHKPFECKICGKKFTLPNLLESHIGIHSKKKLYKCHLCDYKCRHKNQLKTHMDRHNGIKRFSCQICGKYFRTTSARNSHKVRHTGEKKYDCKVCGKKLSSRDALTGHMRTHTKEKPFACPECDTSFAIASNLNSHIKKVHGVQFFKQFQEEKRLKKLEAEDD